MSKRRFPRQASIHACQSGSCTVRISQRMRASASMPCWASSRLMVWQTPFCPVLIRIDQLTFFQCFDFRLKGFLPILQLLELASDLKFLLIQGILPLPKQLFHGGELLRLPLLRQLLNGVRHLFDRKCSSAVGQLSIQNFQLLFGVLQMRRGLFLGLRVVPFRAFTRSSKTCSCWRSGCSGFPAGHPSTAGGPAPSALSDTAALLADGRSPGFRRGWR